MEVTCERCHQPFDNVTCLVMHSNNHPILMDTGELDWELCESCASGILNYLMEVDNAMAEVSVNRAEH